MWLAVVAILIGLAILVWSADVFIDGATALAKKFSVPSFLIGVLILGVGTSAPEMVVSVLAALEGSPELALGNAYGSNIINIALVLGATVLISPIIIRKGIVKRDLPLLLLITAVAAWQLRDGLLSQADGIVLLLLLVAVLGIQIVLSIREGVISRRTLVMIFTVCVWVSVTLVTNLKSADTSFQKRHPMSKSPSIAP